MEHGITGDVALVKAYQGDRFGNLRYRATANNFNADMARAGAFTIAEVEQFVDHIPP